MSEPAAIMACVVVCVTNGSIAFTTAPDDDDDDDDCYQWIGIMLFGSFGNLSDSTLTSDVLALLDAVKIRFLDKRLRSQCVTS